MFENNLKKIFGVKAIILLLLTLCSFILILKFIKHLPYFYILLEIFVILVFIAITTKSASYVKALTINLAAIFLAFALGEVYCAGLQEFRLFNKGKTLLERGGFSDWAYHKMDAVRGYTMANNVKFQSIMTYGDEKIWDIIYTTNSNGLRITPHDLKPSSDVLENGIINAIFFGCSFVFGEGVNDNETLPFLFEEKSGGKYRSYNLALDGYGPHQMLRILETGLLDKIITDKKPCIAIYLAIVQHIERSACKYPAFIWGLNDPKYRLNSAQEVEYAGKFNDSLIFRIKFAIYKQLAKSCLISHNFWIKQLLGWTATQEDKSLFVKIIAKSNEIFKQKYKGKFYIILWADDSDNYKYIVSELSRYHIPVISTNTIFGEYNDFKEAYLIKYDGHPNKLANERIAEYLLGHIKSVSERGQAVKATTE